MRFGGSSVHSLIVKLKGIFPVKPMRWLYGSKDLRRLNNGGIFQHGESRPELFVVPALERSGVRDYHFSRCCPAARMAGPILSEKSFLVKVGEANASR